MKTIATTILVLWAMTSAFANPTNNTICPDPVIQNVINNAARELARAKTEKEADQVSRALGLSVTNKTQLIEQVLYYLRNGITTEEQSYGAIVMVNRLPVDRHQATQTVVAHINTEDKHTRKVIETLLDAVSTLPGNKRDFSVFETILRDGTSEAVPPLVGYMYKSDPKAAVMSLSRVYGNKATEPELVDKLKGDPKAGLQAFADQPEWWVRLYVAEMMQKHPQLRDPAILKKLEQDPHPLVRETASNVKIKLQ
ncbi:MAG: hypothetical protein R6X19_07575 [Kiritimatiellia bacterium]